MQTIRERWLIQFGILFLFAVGNYYANNRELGREVFTYCFLVAGALGYLIMDRLGWVRQFYHLDRLDTRIKRDSGHSGATHAFLVFASLTIFYLIYIYLTGGLDSPLFCIIYLPLLLAGLRFGAPLGLLLAAAFAGGMPLFAFESGSHVLRFSIQELGFPIASLFGAILNSRLQLGFRFISERVAELDVLMDVSRMLETAIDLETTVNLLMINAQNIVESDVCAIYMLDRKDFTLRLSASAGIRGPGEFAKAVAVSALEVEHWKITSDDTLLRYRSERDKAVSSSMAWPEPHSSQALFATLHGSEGVIGLLYMGRSAGEEPFDDDDIVAIKKFAGHVGMPLQKARYQESLAVLAFRDPMTDLSNYRYFEQRLSDDLSRAKRYAQEVTVIIIDIDYFKKFNDTYGHKAGDSLLKQFGQVLKSCLRDSDLPARYGGEEFIVICPGTSNEEAMIVADRIRTAVESSEFDLVESLVVEKVHAKITVSLGTASFPNHATNPADLVRQADRSLYLAKHLGRNMTVSCDDAPQQERILAGRNAA
jgi:diguanylate cyclase (GGDEF)-like protein